MIGHLLDQHAFNYGARAVLGIGLCGSVNVHNLMVLFARVSVYDWLSGYGKMCVLVLCMYVVWSILCVQLCMYVCMYVVVGTGAGLVCASSPPMGIVSRPCRKWSLGDTYEEPG